MIKNLLLLDSGMLTSLVNQGRMDMKFWRLDPHSKTDEILSAVLDMRNRSIDSFLLMTSSSLAREVLSHARRLGVIAKPFSWLILNMVGQDTHQYKKFNI